MTDQSEETRPAGKPKKELTTDINRALVDVCEEMGLTPAELSRRVGVSNPTTVRWLEAGRGKLVSRGFGPDMAMVSIIEERLGLPRGELLFRSGRAAFPISLVDRIKHEPELDSEEREDLIVATLKALKRSKQNRALREAAARSQKSAKAGNR